MKRKEVVASLWGTILEFAQTEWRDTTTPFRRGVLGLRFEPKASRNGTELMATRLPCTLHDSCYSESYPECTRVEDGAASGPHFISFPDRGCRSSRFAYDSSGPVAGAGYTTSRQPFKAHSAATLIYSSCSLHSVLECFVKADSHIPCRSHAVLKTDSHIPCRSPATTLHSPTVPFPSWKFLILCEVLLLSPSSNYLLLIWYTRCAVNYPSNHVLAPK
jgi:hypothetical protein